jgi:hypothetical protein
VERDVNRPFLLEPVAPLVFSTEAEDRVRVEFVPGPGGRVEKLVFTDEDGNKESLERTR